MKKKSNLKLIIGFSTMAFILVLMLIGYFIPPYNPDTMDKAIRFAHPSIQHLFGTDQFGRDIFSRVIRGMGMTFRVALFTNVISVTGGILIGALTGYFGGAVDEVMMRINDGVLSFPSILLALVFVSVVGPGTNSLTIAMGIAFTPSYARIVRSEFIKCRNMDYVQSARLMGVKPLRLIFVHILPNASTTLATSVIIGFNNAVLCEAAMSFLGIGVQPPDSSLGLMLSDSQAYLFVYPGYALFVGFAMVLMILTFSTISDGLKEVYDA